MTEAYSAISAAANLGGAKTCTVFPETCTVSPLQAGITALIRSWKPHKTWAFVADLFGLKERSAKHRLSNTVSYTIEELQLLLQGEDGLDVLNILMADAEPRWWWWAKRVMAIASRRRAAAEIDQEILTLETSPMADTRSRRRLKEDQHATQSINAKLARAETAVGFLVPERSGSVHGAVASSHKQGIRRAGAR